MSLRLHKIQATSLCVYALLALTGCSGNKENRSDAKNDSVFLYEHTADTVVEQRTPVPGDSAYTFENTEAMKEYLDSGESSDHYRGGIMHTIAEYAPEYAEKLIANQFSRFIVVDKASMRVLLYDNFGHLEKEYGMCCAKKYGTKHKKADSRTPEGFFSIEGIYDSTDWLFTDDNGVTSKKKGQFGPRFIRIKIPTTSQIGIHGTCAPWSIGHRSSHGCIRITNEQILELVELVEPGMPVIILPGKRDRAVNRKEGYDIPFFPTAPQYAILESEKRPDIKKVDGIETDSTNVVKSVESVDTIARPQEETESEVNIKPENEDIIL